MLSGDEDTLDMLMSKERKLKPASSPSSPSSPASASHSSNTATITVLAIVATLALGAIVMFAVFKVMKRVKDSRQYQFTNAPSAVQNAGRSPSYSTFVNNPSENANV